MLLLMQFARFRSKRLNDELYLWPRPFLCLFTQLQIYFSIESLENFELFLFVNVQPNFISILENDFKTSITNLRFLKQ